MCDSNDSYSLVKMWQRHKQSSQKHL